MSGGAISNCASGKDQREVFGALGGDADSGDTPAAVARSSDGGRGAESLDRRSNASPPLGLKSSVGMTTVRRELGETSDAKRSVAGSSRSRYTRQPSSSSDEWLPALDDLLPVCIRHLFRQATSVCKASCSSSASRTSGHASSRTRRWPADRAGRLLQHRLRQHAAHLHRAGAALLERSVVQKGVGIGVQNLVRKLRRHGRIDGDAADRAAADAVRDTARSPSTSIASVRTSFITSLTSG